MTRRRRAGEDRLIGWLRGHLGAGSPIGDDAALLGGPGSPVGELAVTVDHQIDGVHLPSRTDPAVVARRLLAVNLSDLAAVGAEPRHAFVALAAAAGFDHRRFFRALAAACAEHRVTLAGGDLAGLPSAAAADGSPIPALSTSLTLLGSRPDDGGWVRRLGARPGDGLWVGGSLGESALGRHLLARGARLVGRRVELPATWGLSRRLAAAARRAVRRHLAPRPQLELGRALGRQAARRPAHPPAALDVSDGLAVDLERLCRTSGVGADVDLSSLPRAEGHETLAERLGLDPQELVLAGGEDYVLLFSWPAAADRPPTASAPERITRIGTITASGALRGFADGVEHGEWRPLPRGGWDHLL